MKSVKRGKVKKRIIDDVIKEKDSTSNSSHLKKKLVNKRGDIFENKLDNKVIKSHKIRRKNLDIDKNISFDVDSSVEEEKLDREKLAEDNLSVGLMIVILIGCMILAVSLGYILYRLAMNSSALIFVNPLLY